VRVVELGDDPGWLADLLGRVSFEQSHWSTIDSGAERIRSLASYSASLASNSPSLSDHDPLIDPIRCGGGAA
jgi:hypothetical protein